MLSQLNELNPIPKVGKFIEWVDTSLYGESVEGNVEDANEPYAHCLQYDRQRHRFPKFTPNGELIPDFLPRYEIAPNKHYPWRPCYQKLPTYEEMIFSDYRSFNWIANLYKDGEPLDSLSQWSTPEPPRLDKGVFLRHFDKDNQYHEYGKYYERRETVPKFFRFVNDQLLLEYSEFKKWAGKPLFHNLFPYEIVFDSTFNHPTTEIRYSAIRLNTTFGRTMRRKSYCSLYNKVAKPMIRLASLSAEERHSVIICEPTAVGEHMKERVMYFYFLHIGSVAFSIVSLSFCLLSRFLNVWPSLYMYPWLMGQIAMWVYYYDSHIDACSNYGFWTTWTNDPMEQMMCFAHLSIHPKFLREETMCFMQRQDMDGRSALNQMLGKWNSWALIPTLYTYFRRSDALVTSTWDVMKRYTCTHIGYNQTLNSVYHRCNYHTGMPSVFTFTMWASFLGFCYFVFKNQIRKLYLQLDPQHRKRLILHHVGLRSMQGERRYMRMLIPLYTIFKREYPRDGLVRNHMWIDCEKYRKSNTSSQFYY